MRRWLFFVIFICNVLCYQCLRKKISCYSVQLDYRRCSQLVEDTRWTPAICWKLPQSRGQWTPASTVSLVWTCGAIFSSIELDFGFAIISNGYCKIWKKFIDWVNEISYLWSWTILLAARKCCFASVQGIITKVCKFWKLYNYIFFHPSLLYPVLEWPVTKLVRSLLIHLTKRGYDTLCDWIITDHLSYFNYWLRVL